VRDRFLHALLGEVLRVLVILALFMAVHVARGHGLW
jgi:hypothetical protein